MDTLLVLNIGPELEEDLVDYLYQLDCVAGFTSYAVHGHGRVGTMSLAEQVTGRRKRVQVEILLARADVDGVLQGIREDVGRGVVYRTQQVLGGGRID